VMANDVAVAMAASQGNYQLNVYMPVAVYNFLQSVRLLADAMLSFNDNCAVGIKPNKQKIEEYLNQTLMTVTALNPYIGYENAAKIAKKAFADNSTLKQAAIELGILSSEEFDRYFKIEEMIRPNL